MTIELHPNATAEPQTFTDAVAGVPEGYRLPLPSELPDLATQYDQFPVGKYWTSEAHDEEYAYVFDVHDYIIDKTDGIGRCLKESLQMTRYVKA